MSEHFPQDPNQADFDAWAAEFDQPDPAGSGDAVHNMAPAAGEGEPQRIAELSTSANGILTYRDAEVQEHQDGTRVRQFQESSAFGDVLTETTTPHGDTTYTYRSLYNNPSDRGSTTWSWQRGGGSVVITTNSEMNGMSQDVLDKPEHLYAIKSNIDHMVDGTAAAMAEAQAARKGRIGRMLGRMGLSRRPRA